MIRHLRALLALGPLLFILPHLYAAAALAQVSAIDVSDDGKLSIQCPTNGLDGLPLPSTQQLQCDVGAQVTGTSYDAQVSCSPGQLKQNVIELKSASGGVITSDTPVTVAVACTNSVGVGDSAAYAVTFPRATSNAAPAAAVLSP